MAIYSIRTTRAQEVGLKFSYDHYADHVAFPTQEAYFQSRIDHQVSTPMYEDQQRAQARSFDESFATVPEAEQPAARTEIETTIVNHGGSIVPPGPGGVPTPPTASVTEPV